MRIVWWTGAISQVGSETETCLGFLLVVAYILNMCVLRF